MTIGPGSTDTPILKLAVLAVGGQGGGVLTGWIEAMARAKSFHVQATSVAGVAQRTGATVYYIEMAPPGATPPVFSLMPAAGDVDILIAAEWMEAGRAIIRGFVTPDKTTLIASTHRALAVNEKMVPGDGISDASEVMAAAEIAARRLITADFDRLAATAGSVVSASLFGALAAAAVLPFEKTDFEQVIQGSKGSEASLAAFENGYLAARPGTAPVPAFDTAPAPAILPPPTANPRLDAAWQLLTKRLDAYPAHVADMALLGLKKVVGFQDLTYGAAYLDRLETVWAVDSGGHDLTREAAKHLANAMAYDDIIRVADEKTRIARAARIKGEMGATSAHVVQVTEYLHPRAEEIVSLFPARMGARWAANQGRMAMIDRLFNKGRHLRSDRFLGFLALYLLAGLRSWRPKTLRHAHEMFHLDRWLNTVIELVPGNPDLAVEVIRCRRLIKGYSDTHARGTAKFDKVMGLADRMKHRQDAALWLARLREAALQDEEGRALAGAVATIESFL